MSADGINPTTDGNTPSKDRAEELAHGCCNAWALSDGESIIPFLIAALREYAKEETKELREELDFEREKRDQAESQLKLTEKYANNKIVELTQRAEKAEAELKQANKERHSAQERAERAESILKKAGRGLTGSKYVSFQDLDAYLLDLEAERDALAAQVERLTDTDKKLTTLLVDVKDLQQLRADKARLDWLEVFFAGTGFQTKPWEKFMGPVSSNGFRAAIDAAMGKEGEP